MGSELDLIRIDLILFICSFTSYFPTLTEKNTSEILQLQFAVKVSNMLLFKKIEVSIWSVKTAGNIMVKLGTFEEKNYSEKNILLK